MDNLDTKRCTKCKEWKTLDCFYKAQKAKGYKTTYKGAIKSRGVQSKCKECRSEAGTAWYRKSVSGPNREAFLIKKRAYSHSRLAENNAKNKRSRDKLKGEIYNHYGRECACCGEDNELFLSIDHVNNDGYKERKRYGAGIYTKIRAEGFPPTYQVLCMNCNWGKHKNGGVCPHQTI